MFQRLRVGYPIGKSNRRKIHKIGLINYFNIYINVISPNALAGFTGVIIMAVSNRQKFRDTYVLLVSPLVVDVFVIAVGRN